jgi:hypothetical protein
MMWVKLNWRKKFRIGVCLRRGESEPLLVKVKTLYNLFLSLLMIAGRFWASLLLKKDRYAADFVAFSASWVCT